MGLWANSALPAAAQAAIQQQVQAVLNAPAYRKILEGAGFEPSSQRDSPTLHRELLADYERVGKVLAGTDIKP
ncbi:hypothetical protein D3C80_1953510 [compost metagenome]